MRRAATIFIFSLLFILSAQSVWATHNRAGQITYRLLSSTTGAYKYEVTITTFTRTSSIQADRPTLDSVHWGDGTMDTFTRLSKTNLPNDISKNIYVNSHTYNGAGSFTIFFTDPNRNADIKNIPNSVSVPFYLESLLEINPFTPGGSNSPIMTNDPIDEGCVGRVFIHNPGAYDPDPNDSLSYELVVCGGIDGQPIPGYTYPSTSNTFTLDVHTGDLVWDSPLEPGEYNVAFNIIQWRNGNQFGLVRRDMQILIGTCNDDPPVLNIPSDTCVLAGDTLQFNVLATDPNHDAVIISSTSSVFNHDLISDPALLIAMPSHGDTAISRFFWATQCHHVRPASYYVLFKASSGTTPTLVDLKGTFIKVIAPAPPYLNSTPNGSAINLSWGTPYCTDVLHYNIYRRTGLYPDSIECPCDNGVPSYTGYSLIGTTNGDTVFTDDNNGQGLSIGIEYCYLVVAEYPDGSLSCASPQSCARLKKDAPVITNADVRFTDLINGSIYVAWSKPTELDTIAFPGPYKYKVYHSPGFFGSNFSQIAVFNNLNDTTYIDTILDTKTSAWSYKIELYYTVSGNDSLKGQTAIASTVFLSIAPTDNRLNLSWEEHVPWLNQHYDVFKQNASLTYDSIATVTIPFYSDSGLVNGNQYCYFIRSSGSYFFSGFVDPIINKSQQVCASPYDNIPPCSPDLKVNSDCNENLNLLTWNNPNNSCSDDVLKYYIYFGLTVGGNFELIDSLPVATDTIYEHKGISVLSGCYKVTAVDSVGNETVIPMITCVDTCRQYVLPSVFTPDGNGVNDLFHPCDSTTNTDLQMKNCPPYKNVKNVDMKIYNRWGSLVFETTDKNINWDGKNKDTKADCSDGVYYYTCRVFFYSVNSSRSIDLHGTVQLIRGK